MKIFQHVPAPRGIIHLVGLSIMDPSKLREKVKETTPRASSMR